MALEQVLVSEVPNLDQVPQIATEEGFETGMKSSFKVSKKLLVIGHRGSGMNNVQSSDPRLRALKENTILSFNSAAKYAVDFIEFDVQITKDGHPVIFHDISIVTQENGDVIERRMTDLCLAEFLEFGQQRSSVNSGKSLLRKTKDGKFMEWNVQADDSFCTLQEAFQQVQPPSLGFNIELKFDDYIVYPQHDILRAFSSILQVVYKYAQDRPIIFSTFHPDAAYLMRKLQTAYPVYFLTNGGSEIYEDVRKNSLEVALKFCMENGLQGIVSEAKAVFRNPLLVKKIRESGLSLLTYGSLNNVVEAVYMQHVMGVEGVIVDFVKEITEAMSDLFDLHSPMDDEMAQNQDTKQLQLVETRPQFSEREIAFLFRLLPQLI